MSETLFHIATLAQWREARRRGTYEISTLDRTLAEEGFIHACRRQQVSAVFKRFYANAGEPLVLLHIDSAALASPVVDEAVGEETYPHIYGPLNVSAVRTTTPLTAQGDSAPMFVLFMREMMWRMGAAIVFLLVVLAGAWIGSSVGDEKGSLVGALAGALIAGLSVAALARRRN